MFDPCTFIHHGVLQARRRPSPSCLLGRTCQSHFGHLNTIRMLGASSKTSPSLSNPSQVFIRPVPSSFGLAQVKEPVFAQPDPYKIQPWENQQNPQNTNPPSRFPLYNDVSRLSPKIPKKKASMHIRYRGPVIQPSSSLPNRRTFCFMHPSGPIVFFHMHVPLSAGYGCVSRVLKLPTNLDSGLWRAPHLHNHHQCDHLKYSCPSSCQISRKM